MSVSEEKDNIRSLKDENKMLQAFLIFALFFVYFSSCNNLMNLT